MESAPTWAESVRTALARYDDDLLRAIAAKLFKPRSQWPADELIDRAIESLSNAPVIDRRVREQTPSARAILAVAGLCRKWDWRVGQLLELSASFGLAEGLAPVLALLDAGLAVPLTVEGTSPIRNWEACLGALPANARIFIPPPVGDRAGREGAGLPALPGKSFDPKTISISDGLEWPLRLGALWQQLRAASMRLTQNQALFKRDLTRLQADSAISAPFPEPATEVPDAGVLAAELGRAIGVFDVSEGEMRAGRFPSNWDSLTAVLSDLWSATGAIAHWCPVRGNHSFEEVAPAATVAITAMLLLAAQPEGMWTHAGELSSFIEPRHPNWSTTLPRNEDAAEDWIERLMLGWGVSLRLVEAARDGEGWWFRLAPLGEHLLRGGPEPDLGTPFPQALVVQPNGEIVVYRQGLSPLLVEKLSKFADWKSIGPACTLTLTAESVYRGLEAGLHVAEILAILQQHSAHPVPNTVRDLVRAWAGKRERIAVHASATLLEFHTTAELDAAFARGLVVQKLSDRIGLVNGEIDYKHFRLLGNRDYEAKPQRCVHFLPDGVTFTVDVSASDLVLEAELSRIADRIDVDSGERRYIVTPTSAQRARQAGTTSSELEQWCLTRAGESPPASLRLLFSNSSLGEAEVRTRLVVTLPSEAIADGVCQWPETASLLEDRLGPTSVAITRENLPQLSAVLASIGIGMRAES